MTTVAAALKAAREKIPAAEARLLLGHVLQQAPVWLLAHDDAALTEDALAQFASLCARRRGGEPVAYLLGYREFYGRRFDVAPGVLIPRPETELLVDIARHKLGAGEAARGKRVLDLGTGSGCIAISVALECPGSEVVAVDCSAAALAIASSNAERLGARLRIRQGDWFTALESTDMAAGFDLILGNPPYIAATDPHLEQGDLRHEPPSALVSGSDGLDAIRHIVGAAPCWLRDGGELWLEHGYDQGAAVADLLRSAGLTPIAPQRDLAGIERTSGGRR